MAVVLTLVQTKQIIYIRETIQKHSTNDTKHSKYKYTYYKSPTQLSKHPHIHNHTLQNKLKPQYKIHTT